MTEGASVKTRILYYNKNIFKISFAKFLNAMGFLMRRVAIFPLLIPLDHSQNFMNLVYLSVTFSFSIKAKQNFEEAIKLHLPAFSFLMFLQLIADYVVKIYINLQSTSHDDSSGYTIQILKLIANDNNADDSQGSLYRTSVITVMAIGFSFIIWCGKYVFANLFVVKSYEKNSFYQNKKHEEILEIDYVGWTSSKLRIFRGLNKISYMSIQSIYETGLVLFAIWNPGASFVVLMMVVSFTFNIAQKFSKKSQKMHFKRISIMVYIMTLFLFTRTLVVQFISVPLLIKFIKTLGFDVTKTQASGTQMVLFISLIVRDCLAVEGYLDTKTKIDQESSLKDKLGTMCNLYDVNDNKLYDRAVLMQINDNLDD